MSDRSNVESPKTYWT